MGEKKNFVVNCEICDTRKVKEDIFENFENLVINAEVVVTCDRSREILNHNAATMNVESILNIDEDMDLVCQNGKYEISADNVLEKDVVLILNGTLNVKPGAEEALKHYTKIVVHGRASYPKSLAKYMVNLSVNGLVDEYLDDGIVLDDVAVLDKYFPMRAKEGGVYCAATKVVLLDQAVQAAELNKKNVQFITPELLVSEDKVEQAISLISEKTKLDVVPSGCAYVPQKAVLDARLIAKYGKRLYVDGNLVLNAESTPYIAELEYLKVKKDIELLAEQAELIEALDVSYHELQIVKERQIRNQLSVVIDKTFMDALPKSGASIVNCVNVKIKEDVSAEEILEKLDFRNCVHVECYQKQKSAITLAGRNLVHVRAVDVEKLDEEAEQSPIEKAMKDIVKNKVINAEVYVL